MDFNSLIGKIFQENELYELLLFDIEENFEQYLSKYLHIYFSRVQNNNQSGKIMLTEVIYFNDDIEVDNKSRSIIEKKEWFEIAQNQEHFNLLLCRFDRTGFISSIYKDSTRTQEWEHGWADEKPHLGPMTKAEIRQAFFELSGFFTTEQELQKLNFKKAV